MPDLTRRVLTAAVGIPLFLFALIGPPRSALPEGVLWTALVMLLALLGAVEMLSAIERRYPEVRVNRLLAMLAVYLPFDAWLSQPQQFPLLPTTRLIALAGVLLAFVWEVWQAERHQRLTVWRNMGAGALIALYLGVLFSAWVRLRLLDVGCRQSSEWLSDGVRLVLITCIAVWVCDTSAYFVGKRFGRRRMSPLLSPRKSWEGALAGVLMGTVAASLVAPALSLPAVSALALGTAASVVGQVGDLFESSLKRELEVKDFGGILPGHGGVLDRFDSLLFALAVIYLLSHFLPICS